VVITPVVTFYLKADGTITAGITAGAIDTFEFSAGVRIDKNGAAPYRSSSNTFEFVYPKPVATASLKVSAGPSLALLLYGAVGPEMGLFGYAQLDIDFLGDPKWRLHAGIEITVGISLLGGLFNYSATIFNFDKELLTASDPPPPGLERYRFAVPGGVVATPAIGPDDRVIVAGAGGTVYALDGEGAKQWSFFTAVDGIAAQPVIAPDGTIYVMAFDQRLYAITSAGQSKWTVDADYGNLAVAANGTIYTTTTTSLQARDPASGNVLWTANLPAGPSGKPTITAGGDLLVPQFSGTLSAITPAGTERWTKVVADFGLRTPALSPDGATAYVSTNGESRLIAVKVADGAVAWSTPLPNGGEQASPAVVGPDGQIYVGGVARKLIAFSPAGVALWGYQTSGLFKGGAVVGADGNVYAASSDGFIHGLKPSGTFLFRRPTFGFSQASLTMDRRGAVLVPSECTPSAPAQCGVSAVFTGASGLASSWAKEGGDLTNTGRR
jgi:sugar lactone lactonase YvrE